MGEIQTCRRKLKLRFLNLKKFFIQWKQYKKLFSSWILSNIEILLKTGFNKSYDLYTM